VKLNALFLFLPGHSPSFGILGRRSVDSPLKMIFCMCQCSRIDTLPLSLLGFKFYIYHLYSECYDHAGKKGKVAARQRTGGVHETAPLVLIKCPGTKSSPCASTKRSIKWRSPPAMQMKPPGCPLHPMDGLLLASKHAGADSGTFVSASTSGISATGLLIGLCFLSTLCGLRLVFRSTTAKPMQHAYQARSLSAEPRFVPPAGRKDLTAPFPAAI
jgi:hypothetical protein